MTKQEKAKDRRLQKLFRISLFEWNKMLDFQKKHPMYSRLLGDRISTDHCHKSGRVRGLLHQDINWAMARLEAVCKDRMADVLEALSLYFRENPSTLALGYTPYGLLGKAKVKKKMVYGSPQADKEPRK